MRHGNWVPFAVTFILVFAAGWGLNSIPLQSDSTSSITTNSGESLPPFVEHFTTIQSEPVPNDDLIRLSWHEWDENATDGLGIPAAKYRAEDLGVNGTGLIEYQTESASATLNLTLNWIEDSDGPILNASIGIHILDEKSENLILRMIITESDVELDGRAPTQNAVVRLYRMTIAVNHSTESHTLHQESFPISDLVNHGMPENLRDFHRMKFVILLSDYETEENFALLSSEFPPPPIGPKNSDERISTLIGFGIILLCLSAVARAEWKREYMLPRLNGKSVRKGHPFAVLSAGGGDVTLREVRVESPWKLVRAIRSIEIPAGSEKTFEIRVKPERGSELSGLSEIRTEWSIEVEEMGKWVLDLVLQKGKDE
ncbi:MAG: hypothetical protein VX320_05985 [Candidatus Thermoplasmatota archaeon]|nr:hypothetical protein [Candidatus Thermoplasmatota archaeon]